LGYDVGALFYVGPLFEFGAESFGARLWSGLVNEAVIKKAPDLLSTLISEPSDTFAFVV